jgi:hypothetical protein
MVFVNKAVTLKTVSMGLLNALFLQEGQKCMFGKQHHMEHPGGTVMPPHNMAMAFSEQ